jgi:hypothetical protein
VKPSQLRDGFATALRQIHGLTVSTTQTSNVQPPHAIISLPSGTYDATMGRGSDTLSLQVTVYITRADDPVGLDLLDDYVAGHGSRSIKTVLEEPTDTGLTQAMVRVINYQVGTASSPDGSEFLAATFDVEAVVSGIG